MNPGKNETPNRMTTSQIKTTYKMSFNYTDFTADKGWEGVVKMSYRQGCKDK